MSESEVYLAFPRTASGIAGSLTRELEALGLRVFQPARDIPKGAAWTEAIEEALASARSYFVVTARDTGQSNWAQAELATLVALAERRGVPLFALRIDGPPVPTSMLFRHIVVELGSDNGETDTRIASLARDVAKALERNREPPESPNESSTRPRDSASELGIGRRGSLGGTILSTWSRCSRRQTRPRVWTSNGRFT